MRLTLPFIAIGLVAGSAVHAQDRYSAGGAQLRGPQPAASAVRAVDAARAPLRLLTWPGKVAAATTSSGPGPFMAAPLGASPGALRPQPLIQPARLRPQVAAPRELARPSSGVVIVTQPPARIAPPVEVMAARSSPAATQAPDWPQGEAMGQPMAQPIVDAEPVAQTAERSAGPPPFTPGPRAWDGARARALPSNIYDPAPPAPAAVQSTPATAAAQPAQPGGQGATRGASPGFTASGASAQTTRRPAGSQAYAAAGGGVPTRQYSVHRKYGGTPDPIQMPADFFASAPSPDLAEPPPPVARRLSPDGKTPAQVRAAEAAAKTATSQ